MTLGQLLILHLMAGGGVATAVVLSLPESRRLEKFLQFIGALFFWPLFLPSLLAPRETSRLPGTSCHLPPDDELARVIAQVDAELQGAIQSLQGWTGKVFSQESLRLGELRGAWSMQAERIRDIDAILLSAAAPSDESCGPETALGDRLRASRQVILQNQQRLKEVRAQTYANLLATLAWVRELVSMIHLAKFTGAPASRAEELVAQIAATVEGLSIASGQGENETPTALRMCKPANLTAPLKGY